MRTGKTTIARRLVERHLIAAISTDDVIEMLKAGAPQLGMHRGIDPTERYPLLEPFLDGLVLARIESRESLVIEGDAFSPRWAARSAGEHRGDVYACFVGDVMIDPALKHRNMHDHAASHGGWLADETPETYNWALRRIFEISRENQTACEELGIPFFDMGAEFDDAVERVVEFFTSSCAPK